MRKVFRVPVRRNGRLGSLTGLLMPELRHTVAVDGVSFRIRAGESVGYLGPNGAGKSTTIKMLTGILVPSDGAVEVAGLTPHRDRRRNSQHIGVLFGQRTQLMLDLPVRDSFDLLRCMYRIPTPRYRRNLEQFCEILETEPLLDRPARTLSLGQRMRCEIIAALLHEPPVLFLDEPTIGLDVVAKDRIRAFIREMNQRHGVTVLLTTHDLIDIERLCPRVIIIDHGRLIYDGSLEAIRQRMATEREITATLTSSADAERIAHLLAREECIRTTVAEHTLKLSYDQRQIATIAVVRAVLALADPHDIVIREETIESIIRRIYQDGPDVDRRVAAG